MVVWIREFLIGRSQRVRVGRHYSEELRVTSGVPQGSVLGPLLFLGTSNKKLDSLQTIVINYKKILNIKDIEKLHTDLDRLEDWAKGNEMKIIPNKSKAPSFTTARVKDQLNYSLWDQKIFEASCCKYLGIII